MTPSNLLEYASDLATGRVFRRPAILLFLVLAITSCGGGGGGGSSTPLPSVHTDNATAVTQSGVTLNGTVNPNGVAAEAWFEIGTNPQLASYDNTTIQAFVPGLTMLPVNQSRTGLTPGTTYYFRLVASNVAGRADGHILSFTTHNPPPAVTTDVPSAVTLTGATVNGTVNPNGVATDAWFEYGEDPALTVFTATDNQGLGSGRTPAAVTAALSDLNSGTTYYYRAVASSLEGEVAGAIQSFSTAFPPPAATTGNATNISTTGAIFNGIVNPNGFSVVTWFEYGTDPELGSPLETAHQPQVAGTVNLAITASVTSLGPYSTYFFRMVAQSAGDPTVLTKGAIHSFPTGEYYVAVGDSITKGSGDNIASDGIGYEPVLAGLLTAWKGYPVVVANEGVSGATSANGVSLIGSTLQLYPAAKYYLILYGTNDAEVSSGPVPKETYKANMQAIVTAVRNAGKIPYLAKVPYVDPTNPSFSPGSNYSDAALQDYNRAIDELVADLANNIVVVPPDLYSLFQAHPEQLADGIHPNGTGYQSMATK
jgi:lysophospholipase L1-like esterase